MFVDTEMSTSFDSDISENFRISPSGHSMKYDCGLSWTNDISASKCSGAENLAVW